MTKGNTVHSTDNEKDIGVTFDTDLQFDTHIHNITKKANMMVGLIKRSFGHMDEDVYKTLQYPTF